MADNKHTIRPPRDPWPLAPVNQALLDGTQVTFTWEPVEGALEYRLQVARDSMFENVALDQVTSEETTSLTPTDFPTDAMDGQTFYWRVMVRTDGGWSQGERIESFVGGTPEQASLQMARPDDDERMGPFPELVRSGGTEIKAELTGKQEYFDQEAAEGVEHEGVETGQIMILAAAVLIVIVGLIGIVFILYDNLERTTRQMVTGISGYPELTQIHEEAEAAFTNYGIIDEESGVYQIPLEQAMELTIQQYAGRAVSEYSSELPILPGQQAQPAASGGAPDGAQTQSGAGTTQDAQRE